MSRNKKQKISLIILLVIDVLLLVWIASLFQALHLNFAILNPAGVIAQKEKKVIITAVALMLIVVLPVYIAAFWISHKYNANNHAEYQPEPEDSPRLQFLWWAFPGVIIIGLGLLTWFSAHQLDPYKPLDSNVKPITIQVVALRWKWLFIYPEQNIATVNFIEFPENTPLNFHLTAEGLMNSFWIPQLGGQMYAMAGMTTQLHLMANQPGEFNGSAAEINGKGFAGMRFIAKSVSSADFEKWLQSVRNSGPALNLDAYNKLVEPSTDNPAAAYAPVENNLYNTVMQKYMGPSGTMGAMDMQMDMSGQ